VRRRPAGLALAICGAIAADAASQPAPAVDVEDLPPLPAAGDEPPSSATVLAAAAAEEEVVVGAAKREQSLGNVASAVTVISADRLRRFGYRTIGEAIAGVAGAYLVDNRLSYSIGIRGLQVPGDFNTRILVLVDGASVNEAWGAYAGLGFDALVGIDEIARIEVIRGPVSSLYGTNAFFGIVNIVTRGAAEAPRAWARAAGQTINGVLTSAGFAAGGVDRQLRGAVHFLNRSGESDLPVLDGVEPQPYGDHARAFSAGLVGASGGSFVQVRAMRYARESPFAPYDAQPAGPAYEKSDRVVLVEGGHARELSKRLSAAIRGFANLYRYADSTPPADPVTQDPLDTTGTAQVYGAEVRGRYELVPDKLGLTAGAEASHARTRSTAVERDQDRTEIANNPKNFNVAGVYAELDGQPARWLGFTVGLRFDHHGVFEDELSPRAALFVARPERYGAKLLYARGFRNPSAFEAYFDDGSDFRAQGDALRAEAILSYEVVAWARPRPGLSVRLSGFSWDARRIIETATVVEDGSPPFIQFGNVTRYATRGVEAEASYRDSRGWYAFAGAALARVGTEDGTGALAFGDVPNAPAVTASAGVSTPKLLGLGHLSTEAILIGERPTRPDAATMAPSPRSPAWLGWNVAVYVPKLRGFDVTLGVRNALGRRDLVPTPEDYDRTENEVLTVPRVPGEGRELYVRIGYAY
jgi:outer membrane receptor protein involved in Fe transport